jgi:hypothetical protein
MTPKPYRWADQATGILLLVAVVFAPWAFGATQEWSIRTLNAVGYVMGGLLAFKWLVRWKVDFEPTRWNDGRGRKWPVRALAAVTVLILVYVLVSALNARARIDYTYQPGQAAATGIDIERTPYRVKLDVPAGSPFTSETILSVVAYHDDTPVAAYAARPSLADPGDLVVAMVPLTRQ